MGETPLDQAHRLSEVAGTDEARMRFYDRLLAAELWVLLDDAGAAFRVFPLEDGPVVLAFDLPERLAEFTGGAETAILSGRTLVQELSGKGVGLGLNLGVAPSSELLDGGAVDWLAAQTAAPDAPADLRIEDLRPASSLTEDLVASLGEKSLSFVGLCRSIHIADARLEGGTNALLLAVIDPIEGAASTVAGGLVETIRLTASLPTEPVILPLASAAPLFQRLSPVSLKIEIPEPQTPEPLAPPGSNPAKPPRLR